MAEPPSHSTNTGCEFAEMLLETAFARIEQNFAGSRFLDLAATELQRIRELLAEIPSAPAAFRVILGPRDEPAPGSNTGSSPEKPASVQERAGAIALVARFCAVQAGHGDAMVQALFREALRLDPSCAMAGYGVARARAEAAGSRASTLESEPNAAEDAETVAQARAAQVAAKAAEAAECFEAAAACTKSLAVQIASDSYPSPGLEYDATQCLFLLESTARALLECTDAGDHQDSCHQPDLSDVSSLLADLSPLYRTPGALALESLARRFLLRGEAPEFQESELLGGIGPIQAEFLPKFISDALAHSQVFCHVALEPYVATWRSRLARHLAPLIENTDAFTEEALSNQSFTAAIANATVVALHCHFVQYCIPHVDDDSEVVAIKARDVGKLLAENCGVNDWQKWIAAFVLAAMYDSAGLVDCFAAEHLLDHTERWQQLPYSQSLKELVERCIAGPLSDGKIASKLPRLPAQSPEDVEDDSPCRAFYEEILYPPWHDRCGAIGRLPMSIRERLGRLFPHARPTFGTGRVLIAGCGSGQQVLTELRSYAGCTLHALDIAPRSVAYARRRLQHLLPDQELSRANFYVADIEHLKATEFDGCGFDLIVCIGVLHHLKEPIAGLQALSSLLTPGVGVLQLATYSTLGSEPLLANARTFARTAKSTAACFEKGHLVRQPTRSELREFRREVFALPPSDRARQQCEQAADFCTTSGLLDLLFHPLECSFTLLELETMLQQASLRPLGVFSQNPHRDWENRQRYAAVDPPVDSGDTLSSLARWHQVEKVHADAFGRMHTLFAQKAPC